MKFRISDEIFRDFDKPFIGVIMVREVDNHGTNPEIAQLLRTVEPELKKQYEENDSPPKGEVVYKDDLGIICRRWNWREGDRTKLIEDTINAILVIESLSPIPQNVAENATHELADLVKKYCGGEVSTFLLKENNKEIKLF